MKSQTLKETPMRRLAVAAAVTVAAAAVLLLPRLARATASGPQKASCVQVFERQRACTDAFIPALVDARRSVDRPAGISQVNRDELVQQAFAEWSEDSKDDAIDSTCTRLVLTSRGAATAQMAQSCLQAAGCDAFVQCVIPLLKPSL
jgi:hypothetical protein